MINSAVWSIVLHIAIIIIGFIVNKISKRKNNNDSGFFWMKNVFWLSFFTVVSFVYYLFWDTGLIRINEDWQVILLTSALWVIAMPLPGSFLKKWEKGLVGTLSSKLDRKWIVWPVFIPLLLSALLISLVLENYAPLYIYNFLFLILLDLVLIALSTSSINDTLDSEVESNTRADEGEDWLLSLKKEGITARKVFTLVGPENNETVRELKNVEIQQLSNGKIPYGILQSADKMLSSDSEERNENLHKIIAAAEDSGQIEITHKMAKILFLRHFTITLVVAPDKQVQTVSNALQRQAPEQNNILSWTNQSQLDNIDKTIIIVIGVRELSDTFISMLLSREGYMFKLGLVVWWNTHLYRDIVASNVSAIAHRLHRVLKIHGRKDTKTLIFIRPSQYSEGENENFIKALFPHAVSPDSFIKIEAQYSKSIEIYTLAFAEDNQEEQRKLSLSALKASIQGAWKTCLHISDDYLSSIDQENFIRQNSLQTGMTNLRKSDAQIINIDESNVLALLDMISQSGRESDLEIHHVGIIVNTCPYVEYLINLFADTGKFPFSQLFIVPTATESIVKKHLMKILKDASLPLSAINTDFQFSKDIIEKTLHTIHYEELGINIKNVRYLKNSNERIIELAYQSSGNLIGDMNIPLNCIGESLIEIINPHDGANPGESCFSIDKERAIIKAYPGCVFYAHGFFYRIEVSQQAWQNNFDYNQRIYCSIEKNCTRTWRIYKSFLYPKREVHISQRQGNLKYLLTELEYQESVYGFIQQDEHGNLISSTYSPIRTEFDTKALIIGFSGDSDGIRAIASALKQLLIVHLAINEDVLQICPLTSDAAFPCEINGEEYTGIALVELYSGGIGLVNKLYDNQSFLADLFAYILSWLNTCECEEGEQCIKWLNGMYFDQKDQQVSKSEAQNILNRIVG